MSETFEQRLPDLIVTEVIFNSDPYSIHREVQLNGRTLDGTTTWQLVHLDNPKVSISAYNEDEALREARDMIEAQRGDLAGTPETLPCYECTRMLGRDPHNEDEVVKIAVTALGPVNDTADPTQTYRLSCGHTVI